MKNSATKPNVRLKKPHQLFTKKSFKRSKTESLPTSDKATLMALVVGLAAGMILVISYRWIF